MADDSYKIRTSSGGGQNMGEVNFDPGEWSSFATPTTIRGQGELTSDPAESSMGGIVAQKMADQNAPSLTFSRYRAADPTNTFYEYQTPTGQSYWGEAVQGVQGNRNAGRDTAYNLDMPAGQASQDAVMRALNHESTYQDRSSGTPDMGSVGSYYSGRDANLASPIYSRNPFTEGATLNASGFEGGMSAMQQLGLLASTIGGFFALPAAGAGAATAGGEAGAIGAAGEAGAVGAGTEGIGSFASWAPGALPAAETDAALWGSGAGMGSAATGVADAASSGGSQWGDWSPQALRASEAAAPDASLWGAGEGMSAAAGGVSGTPSTAAPNSQWGDWTPGQGGAGPTDFGSTAAIPAPGSATPESFAQWGDWSPSAYRNASPESWYGNSAWGQVQGAYDKVMGNPLMQGYNKYGPLATQAYSMMKNKNAGKKYADQYSKIGQTQRDIATQMVKDAQAGKINGSDEYSINQWKQQAMARARQYYSQAGISDSSMAGQAMADIEARAQSMRETSRENMLQTGMQALNVVDRYQQAAIQAEMQNDQASAQQLSQFMNAYGSWLRTGTGSSGQQASAASAGAA